jgi:cytochrome o ubiquinol oxidase subunit 3
MGIETHSHDGHSHHHGEILKNNIFGFWIYIMSDCLLFASLFATYIVLKDSTAGGLSIAAFIDMPYVMWETVLLLFSSFTFGLSLLAARDGNKKLVYTMMGLTFLLGAGFITMEIKEFIHLIHNGAGWQTNAAMSAFFTLVGTHGLHVFCGLFWMAMMFVQVFLRGLTDDTKAKMYCLGLFWHFLDVVWICVFSIVYLMAVL